MQFDTPLVVALVDDEQAILTLYSRILGGKGMSVRTFPDVERALNGFPDGTVDVVVSDVSMPRRTGLDALSDYRKLPGEPEVIFITAHGDVPQAITAVREGAYDYLLKPFDAERLVFLVQRAGELVRLRRKARELEQSNQPAAAMILGQSPQIEEIRRLVETAGPTGAPVLITGDSGTGKELLARSLHEHSERRDGPFVIANCSAFTETLVESELFGHEKGAFTGADKPRAGLFEAADGGTLFLDEIGELALQLQAKLLRAIQEGEVRRVGSSQTRTVNTRIVAATNRDLEAEVRKKTFREDLFYRLNVIRIEVPPLRSRPGDAELLAHLFLQMFAKKYGKPAEGFTPEGMTAIRRYSWPGNIRELKNVVERSVVFGKGGLIAVQGIPGTAVSSSPSAAGEAISGGVDMAGPFDGSYQDEKDRFLQQFNAAYLSYMVKQAGGNISKAASLAGMDRSNFRRLLQKSGLHGPDANGDEGDPEA